MASAFSHGLVAFLAAKSFAAAEQPRFWILSIACSILPDVDVIGFAFGVRYSDFWGHRGCTHSLLFALFIGLMVSFFFFGKNRGRFVCFFFLVTASHGFLDAMTNGGLGVAFFSPFNNTRYFLPWRPVVVSSIGVFSFFTTGPTEVLVSEFFWIILPSLMIFLIVRMFQK